MHKIRKYYGGGVNSSPNQQTNAQWASTLGLPSTLNTIQSSSMFLNNTLNNVNSNDWMKNIGNVNKMTKVTSPILGKITSDFNLPIGTMRNIGDVGKLIGGGFNKLLGQSGTNILGGLKDFTGLNPSAITSIAGDVAGMGIEALGVKQMSGKASNTFDKGLDIATKAVGFIPGAGWVASASLQGANLLNKYAGRSSAKQGSADMGPILGYGGPDVNQMADLKFGFSDTVKGWFGKSGRQKANTTSKAYDRLNIMKSIPGYEQQRNQLAADNSMWNISNRIQQQLLGGVDTRMLMAKSGTKLNPAKLRNIVNKVEIKRFKQGGTMNVIPEGAFHSRKHSLPEDISEQVTKKGIPVVTEEEGGVLQQHAEIEKNEIIFHKKATDKIEDLFERYNKAESKEEKDKLALECGKYITKEILVNTDDRTGLIDSIE